MKNFITNKFAVILIMFSIAALLLSSCKKDTDDEIEPIVYGDAKVSVTNTVSGSNAQDFFQNDTKISTTAVAYGETSPYLTVKAGNSTFAFKNMGSATTSASIPVGLETNWSVSLFYIVDQSGNPSIAGYIDNNTAPAEGKIKVRFINLAPALVNTLTISSNNSAIVNGLGFGSVNPNGYITLDADVALQVEVANTGIKVPLTGNTFVAGKIYNIWFDAATTTTAKFHVIQQN